MKLFGKRANDKPLNQLEELLLAATKDPSARPEFYKQFLNFDLYVLGEAVGPSENLGGGAHRSLGQELRARGYNIGGRTVVALFSSEERIREAFDRPKDFDQAKYVRMNARALLETIPPGTHLVLNPRSPFGKEFEPEEVKGMLDGSIFREPGGFRIPPGEQYFLRAPTSPPQELIAALTAYFRRSPTVKEAYLAEIYIPSSGLEPHLILGISLEKGTSTKLEQLLPEIDVIVRSIKETEKGVDIIEMKVGQIQTFMREQTKPFFDR